MVIDGDRGVLNQAAQWIHPDCRAEKTVRDLSCHVGVVVWFHDLYLSLTEKHTHLRAFPFGQC